VDRRAALAALGALVVTACTERRHALPPSPSASSPPPVDPDVTTLVSWSASERRLALLYAPLLGKAPALRALRDNHTARAAAVADRLAVRGLSPSPVPTPVRKGGVPALVAALVADEREAATRYLAALGRIADPGVAVLGAELAAGARQHAVVLRLVVA
jgi:hypothetical protein